MTQAPSVYSSGNRLCAATPYAMREAMRAIPGSRWSKGARVWTVPQTPAAAEALAEVLGARTVREDATAAALLDQALAAVEAQVVKRPDAPLDPLPFDGMTPPWRHQLAAVRFAEPLPAALWHLGMGTGKTRAALDLIRLREHRRVLVLAPLSVVPEWQRQADRHHPGFFRVLGLDDGTARRRAASMLDFFDRSQSARPTIAVLNYDSFWRPDLFPVIEELDLDLVVYDEIHRLKAPNGKASKAAAKLVERIPNRLALTGTLMPHSPMDVYGAFRALDPSIFGTSFVAFRSRYGIMGGYLGKQIVGYQRQDDMAQRIARITFEVGRDVLDLPEAMHMERTFKLPPEAAALYLGLKRDLVAELDSGTVTAANALTRLLRLMQVASGHVGLDLEAGDDERRVREVHREKAALLSEVLDETNGEPVVVFCMFRHDIAQALEVCRAAGVSAAELSGKANELGAWQRGESRVLVAQMQSGSEGIDLTRARYCVFWSLGYSLGRYDQALARIHRPGQDRPVTYVHLIAEGTVDRIVRRALDARRAVVEAVLDAVRGS